jgi:hypothetical protein
MFSFDKALELTTRTRLNLKFQVSLVNRYVYVEVSKAASSNLKYALQRLELSRAGWQPGDVNDQRSSPHLRLFQIGDSAFEQIMNDPSFRKITFVRNPYSRLLSCFLHRVAGRQSSNPTKRSYENSEGFRPEFLKSFHHFVEFVVKVPNRKMESHYAIQHEGILLDPIQYDLIGKVETLEQDLKLVSKLLTGRSRTLVKYLDLEKSPMVTDARSKLEEFYSPYLVQLVMNKYEEDFKLLGYSTELSGA